MRRMPASIKAASMLRPDRDARTLPTVVSPTPGT
jgi:hypothetical protein